IAARLPPSVPVSLLKSDVPGLAGDVLASARQLMRAQRPVLFLEVQTKSPEQLLAYRRCITELRSLGYDKFWVFDNYGNPLLQCTSDEQVHMLMDYVWRQHRKAAT